MWECQNLDSTLVIDLTSLQYTNCAANYGGSSRTLSAKVFFESERDVFNLKMKNKLALYGVCSNREKCCMMRLLTLLMFIY